VLPSHAFGTDVDSLTDLVLEGLRAQAWRSHALGTHKVRDRGSRMSGELLPQRLPQSQTFLVDMTFKVIQDELKGGDPRLTHERKILYVLLYE
jgi:hypothetical protein